MAAACVFTRGAEAQLISQDGYSYSGVVTGAPIGDTFAMDTSDSWPAGMSLGAFAFRSGVFDGADTWLIPVDATQIVRVDGDDGSMTGFPLPGVGAVGQKFTGGVFDGSHIWLVPFDANAVARVAIADGSTATFNTWPAGFTKGSNAFAGGVFDGQYVWMLPYSADRVLRIDPADGSMTGFDAWPAGFAKGPEAFWGGVFDGGSIWLVPYSAGRVVKLDVATGAMTGFDAWPAGFTKGPRAFAAGTFDGAGVWLAPYDADRIVKVDTATGVISGLDQWPQGFAKTPEAFAGAIFDGYDVWFVPFDADRLLKVRVSSSQIIGYSSWPAGINAAAGNKFAGAVFDGSSIQLVPAEQSQLVTLTATNVSKLVNLSCRAVVGAGDNILIPGFVITGTESKKLLIRGIGPELLNHGVASPLAAPALSLKKDGVEIAANIGWSASPQAAEIAAVATQVGAFELTPDGGDSALIATLAPGGYTVHLSGVGGGTGIGLVELYDADPIGAGARLVNVSARAQVGVGADVLIPGYVISGNLPKRLLVRAIGPGLLQHGVTGFLADPQLV
ncbi:MAG: hypothetical protein ACREIA_16110, partial [Opitutaceae bacterium]